MELTRFIDDYADDIYALALITTKNFDSAKEIFVRNCFSCSETDDNTELPAMLKKAYPMCREAEGNDSAVTLTGIELDGKKQQLLESVLRQELQGYLFQDKSGRQTEILRYPQHEFRQEASV